MDTGGGRTHDFRIASAALSQLSYWPILKLRGALFTLRSTRAPRTSGHLTTLTGHQALAPHSMRLLFSSLIELLCQSEIRWLAGLDLNQHLPHSECGILPLNYLPIVVRVEGFEPTTTRFQSEDSTKLSYTLLFLSFTVFRLWQSAQRT